MERNRRNSRWELRMVLALARRRATPPASSHSGERPGAGDHLTTASASAAGAAVHAVASRAVRAAGAASGVGAVPTARGRWHGYSWSRILQRCCDRYCRAWLAGAHVNPVFIRSPRAEAARCVRAPCISRFPPRCEVSCTPYLVSGKYGCGYRKFYPVRVPRREAAGSAGVQARCASAQVLLYCAARSAAWTGSWTARQSPGTRSGCEQEGKRGQRRRLHR